MPTTTRLFVHDGHQAIQLPEHCRFDGDQVCVRRDPETGDVILSPKPTSWEAFFALRDQTDVPDDFMIERDDSPPQRRKLIF